MKYLFVVFSIVAYSYVSNQEFEDRYEKHSIQIRSQIQQGTNLPR